MGLCVDTLNWEDLGCWGFVCCHSILRGFGLCCCCMLAPNFERTWVVGLLCVVGTKKWEDLDCGIVCVDTKKWEELGCGFVWLALHFERICVVCLCVNTKLRRFGLWVCCVLLALKFEKTWIVGLCVDTKQWEELGCGFVWLALHFERICVVCLCVSTKLRTFGLWVCCVLLALKFERIWRGLADKRVWPH